MIAYKVVRRDGERLRSMYHPTFEYKVGEFVEAPIGGLLVYLDLATAQKDCGASGIVLNVFSAEVEEPVPLPNYRLEIEDLSNSSWIERVWTWSYIKLAADYEMDLCGWWPRSSAAYRRVKLLEVV